MRQADAGRRPAPGRQTAAIERLDRDAVERAGDEAGIEVLPLQHRRDGRAPRRLAGGVAERGRRHGRAPLLPLAGEGVGTQ